jgi:hypothetical protein
VTNHLIISNDKDFNTEKQKDIRVRDIHGNLLREVCKLNIGNAALKLQNEFCELWNHLVNEVQLPFQDPILRSNMTLILSSIRSTHGSLHEGAEPGSEPSTSQANTTDLDPLCKTRLPTLPALFPVALSLPRIRAQTLLSPVILEMPRQNASTSTSAR